ncbi:metal-dependent hydrolase [Campylobacter fetus]|nr:metal-dependent hydrolase [Campylobacter fetus]EJU9540825.1 metal-dependent hydrolase [Campylobacter fetus]
MKIIKAKYILTCNDNFDILEDSAIAFDEHIKQISSFDNLIKIYPDAQIMDFKDDIAMPAFINPHVHLEFSSNVSSLDYGDFIVWLKSVIKTRDNLSEQAKNKIIKNAITTMLKSGISTIGEISSFGNEAEICADSGARFIFFNEILGSNSENLSDNWDKFIIKFNNSLKFKSDKFIPAVSIHSPYSTHPKLAKRALDLARQNNLLVSTHFLESEHEKRWLENGNGEFKIWLGNFSKDVKPFYTPKSFLNYFDGIRTLFTHCVFADEYFEYFDKNLHCITTCPVSNRLLSNKLNLKKVFDSNISLNIATDGLSSNISLNFFDELRAALFTHSDFDLLELSKILLFSSTNAAAKSLGLELGVIKSGKIADISIIKGISVNSKEQLALEILLHTKFVKKLYIKGNECLF